MRHGRVLAAAIVPTAAGVLPSFLVGALAPAIREDMGFGESVLGVVAAAFFVSGALTSAPFGRLVERIGPVRSLQVAGIASAGVCLAVAVGAGSAGGLAAGLAVAGVVNAVTQPAANLLIATAVPPGRLGTAFGVKQSAIPVATFLAGLAVPALAVRWGWRVAFGAGAALGVTAALAAGRLSGRVPGVGGDRAGRRPDTPAGILRLMAVGIGLGAAAAGSVATFCVSSLVAAGADPAAAGSVFALGSAVSIAVRLLMGVRADRRGRGHLRTVSLMLTAGCVGYVGLATGRLGVMVPASVVAFGAGWAWPGLFHLAVAVHNPSAPAAATGVVQTGTLVGAIVGPVAFGAVVEHSGYGAAWLAAGAASAAAAAVTAAARSALRSARAGTAPSAG